MQLRSFNIVAEDSPIFDACYRFDITEVRKLFRSAHASPFDQDVNGRSLFDLTLHRMCHVGYESQERKGLELLQYLSSCGRGPSSLAFVRSPLRMSWVEEIIQVHEEHNSPQDRQLLAEATRLALRNSSEDPLAVWNIGTHITLAFQDLPQVQALLQQDQWPVSLEPGQDGPHQFRCRNRYFENDRQIAQDPNAFVMAAALAEGRDYMATNRNGRCHSIQGAPHSILLLYHLSHFKSKIRVGCKNRLIALFKTGVDPHKAGFCLYECRGNWRVMCVTEYAVYTSTSDLLSEALLGAGWTNSDVGNLLDESLYRGLPALFDEGLIFISLTENRAGFLRMLSMGNYSGLDRHELSRAARELSAYVNMGWTSTFLTMKEASEAFSRRCIPGSWPEESPAELVIGVDFFLLDIHQQQFGTFADYDARRRRCKICTEKWAN
jgi:hypothetical protein